MRTPHARHVTRSLVTILALAFGLGAAMGAIGALAPSDAHADQFFDDFAVLDTGVHTVQNDLGQWTVESAGGQLRIHKVAGGPTSLNQGAIVPKFWMHGDFDVQVAYQLYGFFSGDQAQINLFDTSSFLFAMRRNFVAGPSDYSVFTPIGFGCGTTFSGDTRGYMRVTRAGANITGWYRSPGGAWVAICTRTVGTQPLAFNLNGQNNTANPALDVGYDSLLVNAQTLQWISGSGLSIVTPGSASTCLSASNTCVTVPVQISRTAFTGARGFSVTFQLSSNLDLCSGLASITEGTYLSGIGATTYQVLNNGGGSYTVDCAILGLPCGATAAIGTLFNVAVKKVAGPDGAGTVTVTGTTIRDCDNAPIASASGPAASITIDTSGPVAVSNLGASQVKVGNDGDGTTKVALSFTAPGDAATVEVYRRAYGGYPQYDENGGAAPALPGSYPPAGWALTGVTASGQNDEVATRDFWYYVMYTKDACGNVSAVSNMTAGTLNYHLGDVHNGATPCAGNNLVTTSDISYLGANYGATVPVNGALECLDVGPTTNSTVNGRPTTDNRLQFEDLILFSINYGQVSSPQDGLPPAADHDALSLEVPELPGAGETFEVGLAASAAGDVQGLSVRLDYDPAVVEFVGVDEGELLGRQGATGLVLSSEPGVVDVAMLGEGAAFRGTGRLASARFRVRAPGDARIGIASVTARDSRNADVPVAYTGAPAGVPVRTPEATALLAPSPNPSSRSTALSFTLAHAGRVEVVIYGVDGRRLRTLVAGERGAGTFRVEWDGRDEAGQAVRPGTYFARFTTAGVRQSRTLIRLR